MQKHGFYLLMILLCLAMVPLVATATQQNTESPVVLMGNLPPSDPEYRGEEFRNGQTKVYNSINLPQVWENYTTGSSSVIVAVIDDAVDIAHPDLIGNYEGGFDVERNDGDPSPEIFGTETEPHGTGVAGVIAAEGNNGIGISGVNWDVSLVAIRMGTTISPQMVIDAIQNAIGMDARIINASFASYDSYSQATRDAIATLIEDADVLLVVSAGNTNGNNDNTPMDPAGIDSPNIISVAASDSRGNLTHWSHYGPTSVDLAAPGVDVLTTVLGDGYRRLTGTSYSAPMVTGVAALLLAQNPDMSASELKAALMASVSPLANTSGKLASDGVLNAEQAMRVAGNPRPVPVLYHVYMDDSSSAQANGVIDSGETFQVNITLENIWRGTGAGSMAATLSSRTTGFNIASPTVSFSFNEVDRDRPMASQSFTLTAPAFTGYRRFVFDLEIDTGSEIITRTFDLEAGPLSNTEIVQSAIQKNDFDDFQTYSLDVPADAARVVFELSHDGIVGDRMLDLWVEQGRRPVLQMNTGSSAISRGEGFSYYMKDLPGGQANSTWHAVAYNRMMATNTSPGSAKPFSIRGCFLTEAERNQAPRVDAGANQSVNPGQTVNLSGSADLGENQLFWWEASDSAPELTNRKTLAPSFIAPNSGTFTFTLNASDEKCRHGSDKMTVTVVEESDLQNGFIIDPPSIDNVSVGSNMNRFVQAIVNNNGVPEDISNFRLVSAPDGVELSQNNMLSWPSAGPVGQYSLLFEAQAAGQVYTASMKISVTDAEGGGAAVAGMARTATGCTIGGQNPFDPMLPGLILASAAFLVRSRIAAKPFKKL